MRALHLVAEWAPQPGALPRGAEGADARRFAPNGALAWRDPVATLIEVPRPRVGPGEVMIEVALCGICGTDVHCLQTGEAGFVRFSGPMALPVVMGHELSGVVVGRGPGVVGLSLGERVAAESVLGCGICEPCRRGAPNQCERVELMGLTRPGAFAERVALHERHCYSLEPLIAAGIPEGRALAMGALLEPLGCAYNGLFIEAGLNLVGAFVVVVGAGPIGLGAVMLARCAGAARVIVVEPEARRRALARILGADLAIAPAEAEALPGGLGAFVLGETGGRGADVQVEAAGVMGPILPALQGGLAPGGTVLYLGRGPSVGPVDLNGLVSGAHRVVGARGHAGGGIFPRLLRLMAAGRLPAWQMVDAVRPLEGVVAAIGEAGRRQGGKLLVDVRGGGV